MRAPLHPIALALAIAATPAGAAQAQTPTAPDSPVAEASSHEPLVEPTLRVRRAPAAITIDGDLDDPGWTGAARATGFTQFNPREMVAPRAETEVLVTYDATTLYLAFTAHGDPSRVRATLRGRDEVFDDDIVGILLETFGDNSWAYFLTANPVGVQTDMRMSASNEDPSFDVVYHTAGRITDSGYQVEMAIPFSSLRFPDGEEQRWRVNFYRAHPRESRYQYSWAAVTMDEQCLLCQSGTLVGIEGVQPGGTLDVLPAVVASRSSALASGGDPESFQTGDPDATMSVGVRYPFRAGWTAEATLNPDFSQVESDASQIDVNTTFALFYPERRPFFQEGSDLFDTWIDQLYTRSINAPIGAVKLIGRPGRTNIGYIAAVDEHSPVILPFEEFSVVRQNGRSVSNVLRVKRLLGEASFVGALITDRRMRDAGSGTTVGADALVRLGQRWQLAAQLVGSFTHEPDEPGPTEGLEDIAFGDDGHSAAFDGESFHGRAAHVSLERSARHWNLDLTYEEASPTFRADNGFQTRNDYRRVSVFNGWSVFPAEGIVDQLFLHLPAGQTWNFRGDRKHRGVSPGVNLQLRGQNRISIGYDLRDERFAERDFSSLGRWRVSFGSNFSDRFSFGLSTSGGETIRRTADPFVGHGRQSGVRATIKPTQRIVVEPSITHARLEGAEDGEVYDGYIARTRVNYQFTRELALRLIAEYDDFNSSVRIEPLVTYRLNPYSVLYAGSTHGYADFEEPYGLSRTDRQVFLKLQYLFRR